MIASQLAGKDNIPSSNFPNYPGHGSRYYVLAPFFSLSSTPYQSQNMLIIPQIYAF